MKRLLYLLIAAILLTACGDNAYEKELKEAEKRLEEAKADTERLEELTEQMGIVEESITSDQARELLEYESLGQEDTLTDIIVENGEVKVIIEMADANSIFAEVIYASAGDALLEYDGWEVLTIEFVDVGEISMHRNEKETNEYGMDYFPLEKIIGQLRNN